MTAARALTAHPMREWITNGGNVFNQRYSPLNWFSADELAAQRADTV